MHVEKSQTYLIFDVDTDECGVENGHCNFLCIQTPRGAECICPVGQVLNGTKECVGKKQKQKIVHIICCKLNVPLLCKTTMKFHNAS